MWQEMVHYKKILKNHIFWLLLSTAKIGTILVFFLFKQSSAKIIKNLAKLKITGIDRHVLTIILVCGEFPNNYHLKTVINKNENVPNACHSNARCSSTPYQDPSTPLTTF